MTGVGVGAIVRVPLGGRRVRGYVIGLREQPVAGRKLRQVAGLSGDLPVFDAPLLETLRWAAIHYVAPVAALLPRTAPPNLPHRVEPRASTEESTADRPGPAAENGKTATRVAGGRRGALASLSDITAALVDGKRLRPRYLVTSRLASEARSELLEAAVQARRSALIVMPTVIEADATARALTEEFGPRVLPVYSALTARTVTRRWVEARTRQGSIVVGTREIAFWPVSNLGLALVIEDGRRAMKAPQTPTTHVREVLRRRAAVERFQLVLAGPVPTTDALISGVDVRESAGRVWPVVEVVDRTEEPPGSRLITERVRRALGMATAAGRRSFVLVHRRGYAPAFTCISCRTIRRCEVCGAAADRGSSCRRCSSSLGPCVQCGGERFQALGTGVGRAVEDLRRSLGQDVGPADEGDFRIAVGTERDLVRVDAVDLAVAIDADGLMLAPNYRATEDALRLLARLAGKVQPGKGNRCLIQTGMPTHDVIEAMRSGHPMSFLREELAHRANEGFPPSGELLVLDVTNAPESMDSELRAGADAVVLGPAPVGERSRWLIQGNELRQTKIRLRTLVQKWRDAGARVRVDVDPLDL